MTALMCFVSGTDTEVGKTHVGETIARELTQMGLIVKTVKPVESGIEGDHVEDGVKLANATGQAWPKAALQRLKTPIAPPLAADLEGISLDPKHWRESIEKLRKEADVVMVEGAGGLLSPMDWKTSLLDFSQIWPAAFIVVDSDKLGAVGRSRLCLAALRSHQTAILGVVLNAPNTPDRTTGGNAATLGKLEPNINIATVPRSHQHNELAHALASIIDKIKNDTTTEADQT